MEVLSATLAESVRDLCRRFRVARLYLFGSAASGGYDPARSDLDFLVTMQEQPAGEYARNYLAFANALETLFGRRVDLVSEPAIRNPYFRESVLAARRLLYDERNEKAAV